MQPKFQRKIVGYFLTVKSGIFSTWKKAGQDEE